MNEKFVEKAMYQFVPILLINVPIKAMYQFY